MLYFLTCLCANMILLHGLFITAVVQSIWTCKSDCLKIGIVANGTGVVETEILTRHSHTFEVVKHLVDTTEMFTIISSVKRLDEITGVDVTVLLDYDIAILKIPNILTASKKRLIKMGATPRYHQHVRAKKKKDVSKMNTFCSRNVEDSRNDVYCLPSMNGTTIHRDGLLLKMPVPRATTSVVKSLNWKYVIIFHESTTVDIPFMFPLQVEEISTLVDGLSVDGVLFSLFNIEQVEDLHDLLLDIYQSSIAGNKEIDIIVFCHLECTGNILNAANEFDSLNKNKTLMKMFSKWLIVLYGHTRGASNLLTECANDLDNVVILAVPEFKTCRIEDVFEVMETSLLETLREQFEVDSYAVFKNDFINKFQKKAESCDPVSKCYAYHIDTLLWTQKGREFSSVGFADMNGNVEIKSYIFPNARKGYNKRRFLISTLEYAPFVIKRKVNNSFIYEGFCMDLLDELAHRLNFTYILTEPEDGNWGAITSEDRMIFNGLVGQLQREEVDIVAAPLASQAARSQAMDFSYSYYYEYTSVLVKKPDVNATKWRTLIDPLKWEVLVAIGASLLTSTVLVFLLEKYNPFYDTPRHSEERHIQGGLHELHSSFWYVFGALLCQGGVHLPQSTSGRTLISCWWLTCIIIVGTYCGNLIAFLTVTKEKAPFNTLAEMLQLKDTYKWGTIGDSSMEMAFPASSNPTFRAVGEAFQEFSKTDPTILHTSQAFHINRVKEDTGYAWIGDKTSIEIAMAKECSLMSIKDNFMAMRYVFGFTNNSAHTAVFSEQMIKIHEGGLFQIWKRKWWPKSNFCAGKSVPEAKPISLMDVQSAFYVCFIGIFIGSFAFLIEIILHKYNLYMQERRDDSKRVVSNRGVLRQTEAGNRQTSL